MTSSPSDPRNPYGPQPFGYGQQLPQNPWQGQLPSGTPPPQLPSGPQPLRAPAPRPRKRRGRPLLVIAGVVLALVAIGRLSSGSGDAAGTATRAPAGAAGSAGSATAAGVATQQAAGIGTEVRDGGFAFVVTAVDPGIHTLGSGAWSTKAQGEFILVRVTVTNVGKKATTFSGANQKLRDDQGRTFEADSGSAVMYLPDSESFLNQINPGNSVKATVVFDVPAGLKPTAIELHDSMFSKGVSVALR